jgi:hypothetical protein
MASKASNSVPPETYSSAFSTSLSNSSAAASWVASEGEAVGSATSASLFPLTSLVKLSATSLAATTTSPNAPSLKLSLVYSSNSINLLSVKMTVCPSLMLVSSLSMLSKTAEKSFSSLAA